MTEVQSIESTRSRCLSLADRRQARNEPCEVVTTDLANPEGPTRANTWMSLGIFLRAAGAADLDIALRQLEDKPGASPSLG
jgi:hypothetical protein